MARLHLDQSIGTVLGTATCIHTKSHTGSDVKQIHIPLNTVQLHVQIHGIMPQAPSHTQERREKERERERERERETEEMIQKVFSHTYQRASLQALKQTNSRRKL